MTFRKHKTILLLFLCCLALTACQTSALSVSLPPGSAASANSSAAGPTLTYTPFQASSPTARPTLTLTPTLVPTATPAPTATPLPCSETHGKIEIKAESFSSGQAPFNFRVYTPPCFNAGGKVRYPVLYMIHGQTYGDEQWERLGIGEAADALITTKKSPPFMIVLPQEEDTYSDIYQAGFIPGVINGLIPWIDQNYPTCAERVCRAIGGLSRGGAWALHLGFTNWQLFGSIGMHSTPPFIGDPNLFRTWKQSIPGDQMPRIYMDIGRRDPFLSYASEFEGILTGYGIPHEWYLFNGTHEEPYWIAHVDDYLEWYSRAWVDLPQNLLLH